MDTTFKILRDFYERGQVKKNFTLTPSDVIELEAHQCDVHVFADAFLLF
jgi:hypothetical protein